MQNQTEEFKVSKTEFRTPPPHCWAFGEPFGTAGEESHGVVCTFAPALEHPGALGPLAQPHQLLVALTVPDPRLTTPAPLPFKLF
jgi:hypothetical protein